MSELEQLVDRKVFSCTCPDGERRDISMSFLLAQFSKEGLISGGIARASDLHLKCGSPPYFRIDNEMIPWSRDPNDKLTESVIRKLLLGVLPPDRRSLLDTDTEIDASYNGEMLSYRMNIYRDRLGIAAAIRVLPQDITPVEEIGFPDDLLWRTIVKLTHGLVILTGITGAGKSTTIASLIQRINETRRTHIITLEDPIEYLFTNKRSIISQRQIGRDTASFSQGLRAILREDPDIIFVGEMRDQETIQNAMTAAETGHLVFSTLHTRDAKGTISRICDMFPESRKEEIAAQLSLSLLYVIAQKLVTRADGGGRMVAMEVMKNTTGIANHIRQMAIAQIYSAIQIGANEQMITLEKSLAKLVLAGKITEEEGARWANLPDVFRSSLKGTR